MSASNQAIAEPDQLLQDIQYVKVKNNDAIKIIFAEPVRYISHYPTKQSKDISITLDTIDKGQLPSTARTVETLPVSTDNGIPILGVGLVTEDVTRKLLVRFTRPVNFSVAQLSGPTSITIVILKEAVDEEKRISEGVPAIPLGSKGAIKDETVKKYVDAGRRALTLGKNKDAILIFSKVLSMPANKYTQESLELLGVARERNEQIAHAKAIYQQYLKQYPEGEGAERIKQRYADLVAGQLAPREKLKDTVTSTKRDAFKHRLIGTVAQYYYHGENNIEQTSSTADQQLLISQFSLNHRMRSTYTDIRNFIFLDHEHNFIDSESQDPEISSLYSKIKNSKHGLYLTVGRQSAATAGVLGRFDGLYFGYDITDSTKVNLVGGYPVNISDKTKVYTDKVFYGMNIEFNDLWKNWSVAPYILQQEVNGIADREVIGSDFRYFSDTGNFFGTIDYDTLFDEINIYMLRGQYKMTDKSTLLLSLDYRRNPLLEASNALLGDAINNSIEDLKNTLTEDQIIARALDRTGESSTLSVGINNSLTADMQINGNVTYAKQIFKIIDINGNTSEGDDNQIYYNAQLVINRILNHKDTTIFDLRRSDTSIYNETQFSVSHRIPLESKLRIQSRLFLSQRKNDSGEKLDRIKPSINLNYRSNHSVNYMGEFSYEWWKFGGNTINENYERLFINLGYQWLF
ncbi:tetratricopeptide repeat protein [Kaarinaea lacus]